ncbi:hypothetical protein [Thiomicrorhabdus sediminis]|uniref:Uncharacterized protein n=1 Tax=Thiomicrorhabdus sediminis TaxID=2580412 RepID=A0A4P9K5G2_9GAMM|nr:hypothetical protein [Thiomicrorhabdus sediminis]QCU90254.1 hypothetical protein FE785_06220 [Thiomicrorhabdus sediminis]
MENNTTRDVMREYIQGYVEKVSAEAAKAAPEISCESRPECRQTLREMIQNSHFPFNQDFFRLEEVKSALENRGHSEVSDVLMTDELKKAGFIGELRGQKRVKDRKSPQKTPSFWAHQRSIFAKATGGERYAMVQKAYK